MLQAKNIYQTKVASLLDKYVEDDSRPVVKNGYQNIDNSGVVGLLDMMSIFKEAVAEIFPLHVQNAWSRADQIFYDNIHLLEDI